MSPNLPSRREALTVLTRLANDAEAAWHARVVELRVATARDIAVGEARHSERGARALYKERRRVLWRTRRQYFAARERLG